MTDLANIRSAMSEVEIAGSLDYSKQEALNEGLNKDGSGHYFKDVPITQEKSGWIYNGKQGKASNYIYVGSGDSKTSISFKAENQCNVYRVTFNVGTYKFRITTKKV